MEFARCMENGDYTLSVASEQMAAKAVQLRVLYSELLVHIEQAKTCALSLKDFWQSESCDLLREILHEELSAYDSVQQGLRSSIGDLELIIKIYGDTEKNASQDVAGLPDSVFI